METVDLNRTAMLSKTGHTSKGDQPKWQTGDTWYKADHMGYEALSEVLISDFLAKSNLRDFVAYEPVKILCAGREHAGCVSRNFRRRNEMLIPLERLHRSYKGRGLAAAIAAVPSVGERIQYTVEFVERVTGLRSMGAYLTSVLELDAFCLNEDRHTNNLAVIRNEDTGEFRFCPIFDNGLGLLSDLNDYPPDSDIYECMGRVRAKPFSTDFDEQAEAAVELYGPQLKFSFTRQDVEEQLRRMEALYPEGILRRVRQIVFEQMRKYRVLF